MKTIVAIAVAGTAATAAVCFGPRNRQPALAGPRPVAFRPPPDSAIPNDTFGDDVRLGEEIFRDPAAYARAFVGNDLRCSNCHLDAGRLADSAPMWAAYVSYPAYRQKNGHVNSFEERLQGCFRYSMNGTVPPLGDKVLLALESYSFFLAKGLPTGENAPGKGFPELPMPAMAPDDIRGAAVYAQQCAACHGADGAGMKSDGGTGVPPLWGARSFNWGAGMASIKDAAEFIHANMPLGRGGSLTPQEAWDVAAFVDSQVRPQDPRFTGDVAATRVKFHDDAFSLYGRSVAGHVLGDPRTTPPAGTVPGVDASAAPSMTPEPTPE